MLNYTFPGLFGEFSCFVHNCVLHHHLHQITIHGMTSKVVLSLVEHLINYSI